jgi:hypothetical protein
VKQHSFDPLSFLFGVFFLLMAGAAVFRQDIDWNVGIWVLPAVVLVLGIGLLASSLRGSVTSD